MSNKRKSRSLAAVMSGLGWVILVGLAVTIGFYMLVLRGPLRSDMAVRYFTSHPVSYCATAMFFIGLAALVSKFRNVVRQYSLLGRTTLGLSDGEQIDADHAETLMQRLQQLPAAARESYLGRRLHRALAYVADRRSADGLDDELKYMADMDAAHQHDSFALVRILIWATPMLGFLGTVIGLTQALGNLDAKELATNIQAAMEKLLSGLYVAFDTTALALSLAIILMFLMFLVNRIESELLAAVDSRTEDELSGRFARETRTSDPYLASVERMSGAVIRTSEVLVKQQVQVWNESLREMQSRWEELQQMATHTVADGLRSALAESLTDFTTRLSSQQAQLLADSQSAVSELHEQIRASHAELAEHSELAKQQLQALNQVLEATTDIRRLEAALNDNLAALSAAGQFEHAVVSLSATAQLLAAQMSNAPGTRLDAPHRAQPQSEATQERAA